MNFELQNLQSDIRKKADQWKVDDLNNQVGQLSRKIQDLDNQISNMSQALHQAQQAYSGLHQLLEMLSNGDSGTNEDFQGRILDIKGNSQ